MSAGPLGGPDATANDLAIAAKNAAADLRLGCAPEIAQRAEVCAAGEGATLEALPQA